MANAFDHTSPIYSEMHKTSKLQEIIERHLSRFALVSVKVSFAADTISLRVNHVAICAELADRRIVLQNSDAAFNKFRRQYVVVAEVSLIFTGAERGRMYESSYKALILRVSDIFDAASITRNYF